MLRNIIYILIGLFIWALPKISMSQGPSGPGGAPSPSPGIQQVAVPYVTANIVQPIQINKIADLDFGDIAAGTSSTGTVVVAANGNRTSTGGVSLINSGTHTAANFSITGHPNASISIILPASAIINSGSNSMLIDNFISNVGSSTVLNSLGQSSIDVGATLSVDVNQPYGLYTGTFDVIVAYN